MADTMFDTMKVAAKIKAARINKDMTQMEPADRMGVSYQAVSNWERGNSMPDISKQEELSQILDISIDGMLGTGEATAALKKVIQLEAMPGENAAQEKTQTGFNLNLKELSEIMPVLSPSKTKSILQTIIESMENIDISELACVAPFLDTEYLDQLGEKVAVQSFG